MPRTVSGIRNYNDTTLQWIEFAMRFKKSGLPLEAIIDYMKLALEGDHTKAARRDILLEAKEDLVMKMNELQDFMNLIQFKLDNYYSVCLPQTDEIVKEWKEKN